MMERRGLLTATPAWLHTRRGAIGRTLRTPNPSVADLRSITVHSPIHPQPARYKLRELDAHAPWTSTMTAQLRKMLVSSNRPSQDHGAQLAKHLTRTDNLRKPRQRHAPVRRILPRGGDTPLASYYVVHRPLHSLARTTGHRHRCITATILLND
jgi:hypothetical protein